MAGEEQGLCGGTTSAEPSHDDAAAGDAAGAAGLLRAALRPLERASEAYADLLDHAQSESLMAVEQAALERTVRRIGHLSGRLEEVERAT
jgi:hypothetical protein